MLNLQKARKTIKRFDKSYVASVVYHDIFDYPLKLNELRKWKVGPAGRFIKIDSAVGTISNGYYYSAGKEINIKKRMMNEIASQSKLKIANDAAKVLGRIPTIQMVGVTGALAMKNAGSESDIDLMIVCLPGTLWTTRLAVWTLLKLKGFKLRTPGQKEEKDKLCLNIWLEKEKLLWTKESRNIFTAHEVAQVVPLVNKGCTYERFIIDNLWIKNYWPNSVKFKTIGKRLLKQQEVNTTLFTLIAKSFNSISYKLQLNYMKSKVTNETITKSTALFHPVDWSAYVLRRLI